MERWGSKRIGEKILNMIPAAFITGVILFLGSQSPESQAVREFPLPAKTGHFVGYFALAAAACWGLQGRRIFGGFNQRAALGSFLWALLVAFLDEFIQSFAPGRFHSIQDVFIDAAGAGTALLLLALLSLAGRGAGSKKEP